MFKFKLRLYEVSQSLYYIIYTGHFATVFMFTPLMTADMEAT
jgi:hypothetical protein